MFEREAQIEERKQMNHLESCELDMLQPFHPTFLLRLKAKFQKTHFSLMYIQQLRNIFLEFDHIFIQEIPLIEHKKHT